MRKNNLKIFDSLSKTLKEVEEKEEITVYTCGPTVYDHIHIGNGRMVIVFDLLHRFLKFSYDKVKFVQNITDIDDKIINKSIEENITPPEVAEKYEKEFEKICNKMNVLPIDRPKATEFLEEMNEAIEQMLQNGTAYHTSKGVYLDISKVDYNNFEEKTNRNSRIENDSEKRNEQDFALWKNKDDYSYKPTFTEGKPGRPGWHLECFVMNNKIFNLPITIHGGGKDLQFSSS